MTVLLQQKVHEIVQQLALMKTHKNQNLIYDSSRKQIPQQQ